MGDPTVDAAINDFLDWAWHAVYELLAALLTFLGQAAVSFAPLLVLAGSLSLVAWTGRIIMRRRRT